MNFPRKQIKANARAALSAHYWPVVGILFVGSILSSVILLIAIVPMYVSLITEAITNPYGMYAGTSMPFSGATIATMIILLPIGFIIALLITAGMYNFSYRVYRGEQPEFGYLFAAFKNGRLGKVIGGTLLMMVFLWLWELVFILPGSIIGGILMATVNEAVGAIVMVIGMIGGYAIVFVKAYQYSMLQYLLVDRDDLTVMRCFDETKALTKGYKWQLFVLDLSFIGWSLLAALTGGLLGIFYVNPYYYLAKAGSYDFLKRTHAPQQESIAFQSASYEAQYTENRVENRVEETNDNIFDE